MLLGDLVEMVDVFRVRVLLKRVKWVQLDIGFASLTVSF